MLGLRAMRRFPALEAASGTTFTSALPVLTTFRAGAVRVEAAVDALELLTVEPGRCGWFDEG